MLNFNKPVKAISHITKNTSILNLKTTPAFISAKLKQLQIANAIEVRKQQMMLESLAC